MPHMLILTFKYTNSFCEQVPPRDLVKDKLVTMPLMFYAYFQVVADSLTDSLTD